MNLSKLPNILYQHTLPTAQSAIQDIPSRKIEDVAREPEELRLLVKELIVHAARADQAKPTKTNNLTQNQILNWHSLTTTMNIARGTTDPGY